ncbi:ABC transporter ATP-binding protein [Gryllotalpicola ginsengisoli]|uniref:ABC transporter ATP-binding protein n=1 Tax=Gryllotalpicola ginsengisoli TaxID=444608 RepID=UPI00041C34AC|nr:ABC transporter ATP-binding protein [Gryllotalpicola ginsengisoli]
MSQQRPVPVRRGPGGGGPFGMAMPVEKSMNFWPSARRLLGRLRGERLLVSVVVLFGAASVVFTVVGPKLLGDATNLVFSGFIGETVGKQAPAGTSKAQIIAGLERSGDQQQAELLRHIDFTPGKGIDFAALSHVLAWVLVLYAIAGVFGWLQGWIMNGVVARFAFRLRQDVEAKIHRLPLSYFDRMQRGELLSRVTNDIDNVQQSLQQTLSQLLQSLLTVIGVLFMMFFTSWVLAIISLITIPLTMVVTQQIAKRSQKQFVAQWQRTGVLNAQIEEAFSGHALVKVFGRHREVEERFAKQNDELFAASFGAQFISGIIMPAMMFVGNLVYVVIAVVGGLMITSGALSLGSVQAFIQYSRQFTQPLTQLGSMANLLQSGVASAERVFELLDAEEQTPDPEDAEPMPEVRGRVRFEDVVFSYSEDAPLITGLDMEAQPGQTVAIVGPTGAGKTTLVNLMMRFYDPVSGRITLDGVDTRRLRRAELRGAIGMVLQDTWLFAGTIRDNIAYGRPDATEEEILEAARASYVDRFVHSLPDGYDTVLEDEGANVSAGEKQLLTIARAFLSRPSILILDEATSSVDTRTEVLVQRAMSALRAGRTSFVIAHRLSTIRDADLILVMEHGDIVEQGTHASLLEAGGAYARLYQSQFAGAAVDEV